MASSKKLLSWQDVRRALSSKSKTELLNLIRDLYALTPENTGVVRAHILAPKTVPRRQASSKAPQKNGASKIVPKIRQLAHIAAELRAGASCNITRLTILKSLCEDATAAASFAIHLAQLTSKQMREKPCPSHLDAEQWEYYKQVVDEAIRQMQRYVNKPSEDEADLVRAWLSDVRAIHDHYEQQAWGPVRLIQSTEVLLIEYALSCLLQPHASANWGYRLAREYAERYNSRYGTGLIPESAPMVEDMADFWCQYHLGQPLQVWLSTSEAS
jgi:hypothetical protein